MTCWSLPTLAPPPVSLPMLAPPPVSLPTLAPPPASSSYISGRDLSVTNASTRENRNRKKWIHSGAVFPTFLLRNLLDLQTGAKRLKCDASCRHL